VNIILAYAIYVFVAGLIFWAGYKKGQKDLLETIKVEEELKELENLRKIRDKY